MLLRKLAKENQQLQQNLFYRNLLKNKLCTVHNCETILM